MLQSMTGFGKAEGVFNRTSLVLEIRSLNSAKGLDLNIKLPSRYRALEGDFRNLLAEKLVRGKIDLSLTQKNGADLSSINIPLAKQLFAEFKAAADEVKADTSQLFAAILQMPEIHAAVEQDINDEELSFCLQLLEKAIVQMVSFREKEGESILNDIELRAQNIAIFLQKAIVEDKRRLGDIRTKMMDRMENFISREKIDANRFEQEVVFYLEKLDINEEISRLSAHLALFNETITGNDNQLGRKLNFVTQEMGREINTIGSKANDFSIQKLVVGMKDELEKIKEQTNNIL